MITIIMIIIIIIMIIMIMIIRQEISIAHNPELKARVQCAHQKKRKINYRYKNKNKKQTKHTPSYHTMDTHTMKEGEKKKTKR